jgi:16S rRNA (cytosine967-C5)-methyltransferase
VLRAVRAGTRFGEARDRCFAGLDQRDRRLAYELSAGVLRRQTDLDSAIDLSRADRRLHDVLRLGAYQLRFLSRVPAHAAVSTTVDLARDAAGEAAAAYVNRTLRAVAAQQAGGERGAVPSHPRWLLERWRATFGANETARLVSWNDTRPSLVIQPARSDLQALRTELRAGGLEAEDAPFGAGLCVTTGADRSPLPALPTLPGFAEGHWIVQDSAHALVCRFAAIPRGSLVYDACAAPGGKAVTLERLGACVVAGDARRERMPRLVETVRRAGVAIRVVVADLVAAPLARGWADVVFVDAPCSATGTMARHPDARWRLRPGLIARAAARQRALLEAAAGCVRRGGMVVYATCSLEPEENEAIVDEFLQRHTEFGRAPVPPDFAVELVTANGDFFAVPQRHGVGGAYAARLVRSG